MNQSQKARKRYHFPMHPESPSCRGWRRLFPQRRRSDEQRKAIGWTRAGVGALTTIPLALEVFSKRR